MEAGTVRMVELTLELSVTLEPSAPAVPLRVTVQVEEAPEAIDPGEQLTELTATVPGVVGGVVVVPVPVPVLVGMVIVPPVAETVTGSPATDVPSAFGMLMDEVAALLVKVAVTTATTPLEIVLELMPDATQVYPAAPPEHAIDFPAAVAAAPAVTLRLAIEADG